MAAKMATMFGDVTGLQQGDPPWNIPHLIREYQRLSTEGKIFPKYCNILKPLGRGPITPPSPLYHGGGSLGYDFACTSEG